MDSTPEGDDDDVAQTCPIWSTTCSSYADFYCCALDEYMYEGCADNPAIVAFYGEHFCRSIASSGGRENTYLVGYFSDSLSFLRETSEKVRCRLSSACFQKL